MASDCPAQTGTACSARSTACDAASPNVRAPRTQPSKGRPVCTDNGGVVCDGNGNCVAQHCNDGVKDADETDIDCGGSCGATCTDTAPQQKCLVAGDCVSGVCSGGTLLCQPPTCTDGVQNGNETDKDCGGPACAAVRRQASIARHQRRLRERHLLRVEPRHVRVVRRRPAERQRDAGTDCGGAECDLLGRTRALRKRLRQKLQLPRATARAASARAASVRHRAQRRKLHDRGSKCQGGRVRVRHFAASSACTGTCQACTMRAHRPGRRNLREHHAGPRGSRGSMQLNDDVRQRRQVRRGWRV